MCKRGSVGGELDDEVFSRTSKKISVMKMIQRMVSFSPSNLE